MSGFEPGCLTVAFSLRAGAVRDVTIRSSRPLSLVSRFVHRPLADAVEAVSLLHAVCGVSHAAALTCAAAVAAGQPLTDAARHTWLARLAAERIVEHLRELARLAPAADLAVVREALLLLQAAARSGHLAAGARSTVAAALARADAWLPPRRPSSTSADDAPDALTAADDAAVLVALAADADFAARPRLPGRCPQTGPASRRGQPAALAGAVQRARLDEAAAALARLSGDAPMAVDATDLLVAHQTHDNTGYAAVESPRGRLYYLVAMHGDGRLEDARIVAPTEWNFHPDGPFVRALAGWRPDGDPATAIVALAAQFSPCVSVVAVANGAGHA